MHCSINNSRGNTRLTLLQLFKFSIALILSHSLLLGVIPWAAENMGLGYLWRPSGISEFVPLLLVIIAITLVYYQLWDEYRVNTRNDLLLLCLIFLAAGLFVDRIPIYILTMGAIILVYNNISSLHHCMLLPYRHSMPTL